MVGSREGESMFEIVSTLRQSPIRAVIYGADGIGKSTIAASAPGAVFINLEDGGLDHIDARSVPRVLTWPLIVEAVDMLGDDERCGTIVIDSLDWAEQLLWAHLVATKPDEKGRKVRDIEGYGYGKGYMAALVEWRVLLAGLQRAGSNGKNVILTAHAKRAMVKNPIGEDFEQWQLALQDGKNVTASGTIRQWAHIVGFADFDIATVTKEDDGGRTKGIFTGKRILRTQPHAGYQSKSRLTLPAKIPLDWAAFSAAVAAGRPPSVDELGERLSTKLAELGDEKVMKGCESFLQQRGRSLASLTEALATVDGYLEEKKKEA